MPQKQQIVNQVQNQNFGGQQNNVIRTDNEIRIYEYSDKPGHYTETIIYRDCQGCPSPGVYYRTANGVELYDRALLSNKGVAMCKPLLNLEYTGTVWGKHDLRHNFSEAIEREAGPWARIVIKNAINDPNQIIKNTKKFKIFVTIPGEINEIDNSTGQAIVTNRLFGVFEFEVKKDLYQQKGKCFHRFFAPNGMVGAEGFGVKERAKAYKRVNL